MAHPVFQIGGLKLGDKPICNGLTTVADTPGILVAETTFALPDKPDDVDVVVNCADGSKWRATVWRQLEA